MNRLLASEMLKLTSLRSLCLAVAAAVFAVGLLAGAVADAGRDALGPAPADPVALPMEYFAYAVMVVSALAVTSDMVHGTYRVTLGQVASPTRVLLAKLTLGATLGTLLGLAAFASVAAGALAGDRDALSLAGLRDSALSVAVVPLVALLSISLGALIRQTAAALTSLMVWALGVETVLVLTLPTDVGAYLPFKTIGASRTTVGVLGPWEGIAVFAAYTAGAVLLALLVQSRRDAPLR